MTRPADRHPEAAWQTLRDRDASDRAVQNARETLHLRDDEFALLMKRAPVRPDDNRSPPVIAHILAAILIVGAVVVTLAIATKAMGNVNDTRLDAEEWKGW